MSECKAGARQQGWTSFFWQKHKETEARDGTKASKLHQQKKKRGKSCFNRVGGGLSLSLSSILLVILHFFQRKDKKNAMDSSECQWDSSELFMLPVDLGMPRYTPISPSPGLASQPLTRSLTHSLVCHSIARWRQRQKVPIKISVCEVSAGKKKEWRRRKHNKSCQNPADKPHT